MISIQFQPAMGTIMNTHFNAFRDNRMATGAHLRCTPGVNECHHPTSVCSFVGGELHELTPGYIGNAAGVAFIFRGLHVQNVEFLKSDELIFVHQFTRLLMGEVAPSIRHPLVSVIKGVDYFLALKATFGKLLFPALQAGNVGGIFLHPALALNLLTVAEIGEGGQAQVNAHRLVSWFKWYGFRVPTGRAGKASIEIANGVTLDCQCLDRCTDRAMQLNRHVANLGERDLVANEFEARLLEGEAVVVPIALEAWKPWFFFASFDAAKECLIRQIYTFLHVLQYLRMNANQRWLIRFPFNQQFVRIVQGNRFACFFVGVLASSQRFVVDETAKLKRSFEACALRGCWEKAVLVRQSHASIVTYLRGLCNYVNMQMQGTAVFRSHPKGTRSSQLLKQLVKPLYPTAKAGGLYGLSSVKEIDDPSRSDVYWHDFHNSVPGFT